MGWGYPWRAGWKQASAPLQLAELLFQALGALRCGIGTFPCTSRGLSRLLGRLFRLARAALELSGLVGAPLARLRRLTLSPAQRLDLAPDLPAPVAVRLRLAP